MEEKLLLFFGVFLLVTKEQSALYINDCSSGVRDVTEDTYVSFTCGVYSSFLDWSFSRDHQLVNSIGSCSNLSCSPQSASLFTFKVKTLLYQGYESTLYIKNVSRQYNVFLHCSEGSAIATCRLRVIVPVSIVPTSCSVDLSRWKVQGVCTIQWQEPSDTPKCRWRFSYQTAAWWSSYVGTNSVDLGEFHGSLTSVTVDSVRYKRRQCSFDQIMPYSKNDYSYTISVSSHPDDQFSKSIRIVLPEQARYTCPGIVLEGSSITCKCSSLYEGNPPAVFVWEKVNSDTLQLQNLQRQDSGNNYTCRLTWGPNELISHKIVYTLNVKVPVSIVPNSCSVELSGWNVYGVCLIKWLRTTKSFTCEWRTNDKKKTERLQGAQRFVSGKPVDNYDYVNCSFVHQMPVDNANYTYSISVSSHPADQFSKTLHFEKPDAPKHNCSNVTLEGSSINCTCFSSNLGNPPAQIGWAETNNEHFAIKGITREKNGIVATCRLTWGTINYTTPYVVEIAYGPSETYINREEPSEDKTTTVLICTASDVYPSALFRWNISCDNETHSENISRCTVSTARIEDEMAVECRASNQIFVDVSSSSTYVFKLEQNPLQWGIIAGIAAAVIILAIIAAVVVVYIKRRKDVNKNMTQTQTVHFTAPSGDIYTIAGNALSVDDGQDEYVTVRDTTNVDNIPKVQSPVERFAAPSGDLYTIAGPATAVEKKQVTMQEANKNRAYVPQCTPCHQAKNTAHQKNEERKQENLAKKPKPKQSGKKKPQHLSVDNKLETHTPALHLTAPSGDLYTIVRPPTGCRNKQVTVQKAVHAYQNVTAVPTDSGLGVYHIVPWAAAPQAAGSDAGVLDTSVISEEEYNVLRFQENRTTQEDHAVTYSHLDFK